MALVRRQQARRIRRVGLDADDDAGIDRLLCRIEQVVAHVADVHTVVGVDEPVAQAEDRHVRQIGKQFEATPVQAVDLPGERVADEDAAIAHVPEAVRLEGQFRGDFHPAGDVDGQDPLPEDVDEPQLVVAPARVLGEHQAARVVDQRRAGVDLHGLSCRARR